MASFYVTFPEKYRHHPHPHSDRLGAPIHPDGFVTVLATDRVAAANLIESVVGTTWHMVYDQQPPKHLFPKGSLATIPNQG